MVRACRDAGARVHHPAGLVLARLVFRDPDADPAVHRDMAPCVGAGISALANLHSSPDLFLGALEAVRIDAIGPHLECARRCLPWPGCSPGIISARREVGPAIGAFLLGLVPGSGARLRRSRATQWVTTGTICGRTAKLTPRRPSVSRSSCRLRSCWCGRSCSVSSAACLGTSSQRGRGLVALAGAGSARGSFRPHLAAPARQGVRSDRGDAEGRRHISSTQRSATTNVR